MRFNFPRRATKLSVAVYNFNNKYSAFNWKFKNEYFRFENSSKI